MSSKALAIIKTLYGREAAEHDLRSNRRGLITRLFRRNRARAIEVQTRQMIQARNKLLTKKRVLLGFLVVFVPICAIISIHYFNQLMRSLQDLECARAGIDTLLQRRLDISINLSRMVHDYAKHEQLVFKHVSNKRTESQTGEKETADGGGLPAEVSPPAGEAADGKPSVLGGLFPGIQKSLAELPKIMAIAEQFPELKLSENFKSFMQALVDVEKELSESRKEYARTVNIYTTNLKTFPGNLYAKVYGFKDIPYLEAEERAKRLVPVEY